MANGQQRAQQNLEAFEYGKPLKLMMTLSKSPLKASSTASK